MPLGPHFYGEGRSPLLRKLLFPDCRRPSLCCDRPSISSRRGIRVLGGPAANRSLVGRLLTICPSVDQGCNRHFWSSSYLKYQSFLSTGSSSRAKAAPTPPSCSSRFFFNRSSLLFGDKRDRESKAFRAREREKEGGSFGFVRLFLSSGLLCCLSLCVFFGGSSDERFLAHRIKLLAIRVGGVLQHVAAEGQRRAMPFPGRFKYSASSVFFSVLFFWLSPTLIGHNARPLDGTSVMSLLFQRNLEASCLPYSVWVSTFVRRRHCCGEIFLPGGTEQIGRGNFCNSTNIPLWQLSAGLVVGWL